MNSLNAYLRTFRIRINVCMYVFHCWSWDQKCSLPKEGIIWQRYALGILMVPIWDLLRIRENVWWARYKFSYFSPHFQIDQCMNTIIPIEELKLGLLQFDNLESLTPETNTRMVESALLKESSVLANTIAVMKKEGRDPDSVAKWLAHVNNRMIKAW